VRLYGLKTEFLPRSVVRQMTRDYRRLFYRWKSYRILSFTEIGRKLIRSLNIHSALLFKTKKKNKKKRVLFACEKSTFTFFTRFTARSCYDVDIISRIFRAKLDDLADLAWERHSHGRMVSRVMRMNAIVIDWARPYYPACRITRALLLTHALLTGIS